MHVTLANRTVGVIGSGTAEHESLARPVGELLSDLGVNLLTGGGGGVMRAVSRAFTQPTSRRGICIGIIPCASERDRGTPRAGYPNEFVELPVYTHLPYSGKQGTDDLSRNHINVLSCAAIVALPGDAGTVSELLLALRYGKPVVAYSPDPKLVRHFPEAIHRFGTIDEVERFLNKTLLHQV
jgi:uncharacterized protein (TIGR00725 family)